jgi:serine/threonine protein kinase
MSDRNLVHVVDHSMAMLGERICEATTDNSFRYCLKAFEQSLGRFRNSEIELGKRISSGSFADIYLIRSFRRGEDTDGTAFTQDQARSVHRVKQSDPDKYVVKVLRKNLLINTNLFATGAADFITEGTLLASFDHPNIISIRGRSMHGVEGFSSGKRDSVFFVLERVDGDLTDKLREWKKRTSKQGLFAKGRKSFNASLLRERLALMADLAAALSYLHERHVIHRDVALSNVGISAGEGQVKLLDFGLAKVLPFSKNENERFLLTGKTGSMR